MSTYGDRGNVIVLQKRCEWRDIDIKVKSITLETSASEVKDCDLIFMGGAQDRQQKIVSDDFLKSKGKIVKEMVEDGVPSLFVCAAYQFVGHYYRPYQGEDIPGAGIFDLTTQHPGDQAKRLIGNVVAELLTPLSSRAKRGDLSKFVEIASSHMNAPRNDVVVGFENHGGRTKLGSKMRPLARVKRGFGNNGEDGYEGAYYKNSIGSYFHGPLLPKNPHIADWLITKALEKKYKIEILLTALGDELENEARAAVI